MSSPVHHASLVDPSRHSPALLQLVQAKVSRPLVEYLINCVVDTVDFAMGRSSTRSTRDPKISSFTTFVVNVITRAEVSTPVLLATFVYIERAKPHLHIALEEWALERVLLGALMVASKYLNDSTLKNVHWALCTGVFGKRDVGRIEREFLDVLDFELRITEDDLLVQRSALVAYVRPHRRNHIRHATTLPPLSLPSKHTTHPLSRSAPQLSTSVPKPDTFSSHRGGASSPIPPLSPSSSNSSASSPSSPCTPQSPPHHGSSCAAPVQPLPDGKKASQISTSELLRLFPLPVTQSNPHGFAQPPSISVSLSAA